MCAGFCHLWLGIYIDTDVSLCSHVTGIVSTPAPQHLPISSSIHSPVAGVVCCFVTAGAVTKCEMDYGILTLSGIPQYLVKRLQSVGELDRQAGVRFIEVQPRHFTTVPTPLGEGRWADRVQTHCPRVHVAAPLWQTLLTSCIVQPTPWNLTGSLLCISVWAFQVAGPRVWNALMQHVTSAISLPVFHLRSAAQWRLSVHFSHLFPSSKRHCWVRVVAVAGWDVDCNWIPAQRIVDGVVKPSHNRPCFFSCRRRPLWTLAGTGQPLTRLPLRKCWVGLNWQWHKLMI